MSISSPPTVVEESPEKAQQTANNEPEIVVFQPDDPEDPHQWSPRKKRGTVALTCAYAFCAVFGSAVYVRDSYSYLYIMPPTREC